MTKNELQWGILAAAIVVNTQGAFAAETALPSGKTTSVRGADELLQWTPESVTVLSGEEAQESGAWTLSDLEGIVPGLLIDTMAGMPEGAMISLRGIGSNEAGYGFFPAVAVSVDGVYSGSHASQDPLLFDAERIEVARGSQGVYSGPPALAGTIDIYRTRPTGKLSAKTRLTLADYRRT
ncbi:MAG: TonB-dependent receptor plug domain-containing protein, partial [Pseudomonadales bacterium]|nr:TonB-dependent receptor plug domain-containing protein [Pseudomonadales bacterium]